MCGFGYTGVGKAIASWSESRRLRALAYEEEAQGFYRMTDYRVVGFRRSETPRMKYDAILMRQMGQGVYSTSYIPFGTLGDSHYDDKTGLGLYSDTDHHDEKKRQRFIQRRAGLLRPGMFSAAHFEIHYL